MSFSNLPPELVRRIVSYFEASSDTNALASTNRTLRQVVFGYLYKNRSAYGLPSNESYQTIPLPEDDSFVRRTEISQRIRQGLVVDQGGHRRFALVGIGGIGKTQIATQHAYDLYKQSSASVFWLDCHTVATLRSSYTTIASRLQLPAHYDTKRCLFRLVHGWLCDVENGPWLVVIDDLNESWPISSFIPECSHGSILVTSRNTTVVQGLVGEDNICFVPPMCKEEALNLLAHRLPSLYNGEGDRRTDLVIALDCVPMAIVQAAATIWRRHPHMSVEKYVNDLENGGKKSSHLKRTFGDLRTCRFEQDNSVMRTWETVFERIYRESRSAALLLCRLSASESNTTQLQEPMTDDMEILSSYSLITKGSEAGDVHMLSLVQFCIRKWAEMKFKDLLVEDIRAWKCGRVGEVAWDLVKSQTG
ncbi:hypothetical protein NCS56_01510500 [Fusarium sp. Ph1]|nr:hypothetical protein NCS56_01510500 [Fusarium sp. Ph1]